MSICRNICDRLAQPLRTEEAAAPARERTEAEAAALVAIYETILGANRVLFRGTLFEQADQISAWMNQNRETLEGYRELYLSRLGLQALPSEIRLFQNLQALYLWGNQLQALPSEIGNLRNLLHLNLSYNQLQALPSEIGNLSNLQELDLSDNQLQALPSEIGNLPNLLRLKLRNNRLQALPPGIGNLPNLQELNISSNRLQELPPEIGNLRNLLRFDLSSNQLQALLSEIGNLPNLRVLDISSNQLQALPSEIGNLPNLQELNLTQNRLQELPPEIGHLPNLQELHLSSNRLQELPPEIGNLRNLRNLDLWGNQLQTLPESITSLPPRCTVNAQRNRFNAAYAQDFLAALARHRAANPLEGPNVQVSIDDASAEAEDQVEITDEEELDALVEERRFNAAYAQVFFAPLGRHREANPLEGPIAHMPIHDAPARAERQVRRTVEQELAAWAQEIAATFPEKGGSAETNRTSWLSTLNEDAKSALQTYLQKVRRVSDYQNGGDGKINIIRRVNEMIELASKNQEFRAALLGIIYEGNETCGDRVHLIFNDIEILTKMYGEELTDYEFSELAIRASRYELLKKYAKKVAQQNRLGDQIETILYYLVKLQKDFDFPTTTKGMLYAEMAGVSQEMLQAAREEISRYTDLELLAASDYWLSRMERKNPERVQQINEEYEELLGIAQELDYSAAPLKVENDRLKEIIGEKKCSNYQELSDLIDQKRREVIARIETASAAAGNV